MRQVDRENVTEAPGWSCGTVNVPDERDREHACARGSGAGVRVRDRVLPNELTNRTGNGVASVLSCVAAWSVLPAGPVARIENAWGRPAAPPVRTPGAKSTARRVPFRMSNVVSVLFFTSTLCTELFERSRVETVLS